MQAKRLECDGQEGVACLIERIQVAGVPCGRMRGDAIALDQGAVDAAPVEEPLLLPDPTKYRIVFRVSDYVPEVTWSVGVVDADYASAPRHGTQADRGAA